MIFRQIDRGPCILMDVAVDVGRWALLNVETLVNPLGVFVGRPFARQPPSLSITLGLETWVSRIVSFVGPL